MPHHTLAMHICVGACQPQSSGHGGGLHDTLQAPAPCPRFMGTAASIRDVYQKQCAESRVCVSFQRWVRMLLVWPPWHLFARPAEGAPSGVTLRQPRDPPRPPAPLCDPTQRSPQRCQTQQLGPPLPPYLVVRGSHNVDGREGRRAGWRWGGAWRTGSQRVAFRFDSSTRPVRGPLAACPGPPGSGRACCSVYRSVGQRESV